MGINILEAIDNLATGNETFGFQVAFIVTYNVNLQFFEKLVMPKLERIGVSYIGVLVDRHAYQASLSDPIRAEQCGKSYVMGYSPWLRGLQHGKLLWLHGDQDIVFIGSHNLTRSGFNDSLETTVLLDSRDPTQLSAVKSAHGAVSALVKEADALSRIWSRIPEPVITNHQPTTHFFWSGYGSLLDQLQRLIGPAKEIRVVTPFLDAQALCKLYLTFSAKKVILDLPFEGADTPLDDALASVPNLTPRVVNKPNHLHGKAYELNTENSIWLAIGSANCTNAGIINGIAEGGNSEFLAVFQCEPLEDERVEFRVVEDPAKFTGTGRRWDEVDPPPHRGITYFCAMYEDQTLTTVWESNGRLSSPHLTVGNVKFELDESPSRIPMKEEPPRFVTLSGRLDGENVSTDTWVIFFNELARHASGISTMRRRSYLESGDPMEQAFGVELEIFQLLRALQVSKPGTIQEIARVGRQLEYAEADQAITVFEFSPDPDEITKRAASLIVGDRSTDPLAMIRGLIARITGPIPRDHQSDEESIEDYNLRRDRAMRRISDVLVRHLSRLSKIDKQEWRMTPNERIKLCLQLTFEVVVLLWWKVLRRDSHNFQRFTQAMLDFVQVLMDSERRKELCRNTEVAGPLVLAIAAAGEATSEEHERDLLRGFLTTLFSSDYRANVQEWFESYPTRAAMIIRVQGEYNDSTGLEARLRAADRLMGVADKSLLLKQEQKYGALLRFIEATEQGSPTAESLFSEAESKFSHDPIWQECINSINAGQNPVIVGVSKPICGRCFLSLPVKHWHELEQGQVILCPNCGTILMFGRLL